MTLIYKPIKFPKDNFPHKTIIEWWYFNCHLKDSKGKKYSLMNCLFKANNKKVNIPLINKLPFETIYFSHSQLTDIDNKKFYSEINPLSIISYDSFNRDLVYINYTNPSLKGYLNCVIEEIKPFVFHIKSFFCDLILTSIKKPLLVGKTGFVKLNKKSTYYYSLTKLETNGYIFVKNKPIKVKGISWMDHQWANEPYSKDKWTWFCFQLNNNTEIVCFEYDDKIKKTYLATINYPNGTQKTFSDIKIVPTQHFWKSQKTGAQYPLQWNIEIPQANVSLQTTALLKNQEMIFGEIIYWEGPTNVCGTFNNHKVVGNGFMELVGFPVEKSKIEIFKSELKERLNNIFHLYIKKFVHQKFPIIKKFSKFIPNI
ncbi:MAG: lipocalin family protein [Endomicrobiia bacterium]